MPQFLGNQPDNLNYLSQFGFRFVINRLPNVNYFCQTATIPAINMPVANQPTPLANIPRPGDKLTFEQFTLRFKVDEDLKNYKEIHSWLIGLGHPISLDQTRQLSNQTAITPQDLGKARTFISDGTLIVLTSHKNPNKLVVFRDMFPTSLSELTFDTTDIDVNFLEATVTFAYLRYEFLEVE